MIEYGWLDHNNNVVKYRDFAAYINRTTTHITDIVQLFENSAGSVSTVFLGMTHNSCWFETCIFYIDGRQDVVECYHTYDAALAGHYEYVGYLLLSATTNCRDTTIPYSTAQLDFIGRHGVFLNELSDVDLFTFDMMA